jgi:uncharacterized metal-binding protein
MDKSNKPVSKLKWLQLKINIHAIWRVQFYFLTIKTLLLQKSFFFLPRVDSKRPLVFSCSGCVGNAKMANYIASQLDKGGIAEKWIINNTSTVDIIFKQIEQAPRKIIAIDGCALCCIKSKLTSHALQPDTYFELTALGVKRMLAKDFNTVQADNLLRLIKHKISIKYKPGFYAR